MGVPLPRVLGVLSDSAKLKFSNINSQLAELKFLPVIVDDFANLNAWTEVDADGKVNLSGGVISLDGENTWDTHGVWYTAGIARAAGYLEYKSKLCSYVRDANYCGFSNTAGLTITAGAGHYETYGSGYPQGINAYVGIITPSSLIAMTAGTYYTLRVYIGQCSDASWRKLRLTIQGGTEFPAETDIYTANAILTSIAATIYPMINRYRSDPTGLSAVKEFRWYSGYATDAPYVEYVHDAGAGLAFDNLNFTAFVMPGTVPTTNLTYAYSFDDGVASYNAALTLANLQAVGKLTARHRYIRMRVYANSDGATLVYVDKPNSDTATDGIGVDVDAAIAAYQAANNSAPSNGNNSLLPTETVKVAGTTYTGPAAGSNVLYLAVEALRNALLTAANLLLGTTKANRGINVSGNQVMPAKEIVKDGEFFGEGGLTEGEYDNATNPDWVIHSKGGNWIDEQVTAGTLVQGAVAGVAGAIIGRAGFSGAVSVTNKTRNSPVVGSAFTVLFSSSYDLSLGSVTIYYRKPGSTMEVPLVATFSAGPPPQFQTLITSGTNDTAGKWMFRVVATVAGAVIAFDAFSIVVKDSWNLQP